MTDRTEIIALAKQCGASAYTNRHYQEETYVTFSPEKLEAFFHAAQRLEREKLQNELHDANMHIKQLERGFDKVIRNRNNPA